MAMGEFRAEGAYKFDTSGNYVLDSKGLPVFKSRVHRHQLVWPCDGSAITKQSWFSLSTGWGTAQAHVWYVGQNADGTPHYLLDEEVALSTDHRYSRGTPAGTQIISVLVESTSTDNPVAWCLESQAQ